jgi:hypothetical protein
MRLSPLALRPKRRQSTAGSMNPSAIPAHRCTTGRSSSTRWSSAHTSNPRALALHRPRRTYGAYRGGWGEGGAATWVAEGARRRAGQGQPGTQSVEGGEGRARGGCALPTTSTTTTTSLPTWLQQCWKTLRGGRWEGGKGGDGPHRLEEDARVRVPIAAMPGRACDTVGARPHRGRM